MFLLPRLSMPPFATRSPDGRPAIVALPERLGIARSREITRRSSATFYLSLQFLALEQRRALWTIYAFCRLTDDIVDSNAASASRLASLDRWQHRVTDALDGRAEDPVLRVFAATMRRYRIDPRHAFDLIEGARRDLTVTRYDTYAQLLEYCDLVASTVGLLTLPILGTSDARAELHAISLGRAMQMTNILRDVGEDAALGRIYLPREDSARFGCDEDAILRGEMSDAFIALMRFQIERNRRLYRDAELGIAYLSRRSRYTVRLALQLYRGILMRIERNAYDVHRLRAYVPLPMKMRFAVESALGRG